MPKDSNDLETHAPKEKKSGEKAEILRRLESDFGALQPCSVVIIMRGAALSNEDVSEDMPKDNNDLETHAPKEKKSVEKAEILRRLESDFGALQSCSVVIIMRGAALSNEDVSEDMPKD